MATRQATTADISPTSRAYLVTWSGLTFTTTDDGAPVDWIDFADRSIQVVGTFGATGAVTIEGSNNGVDWAALSDPQGNVLTITNPKIEQVLELTRYVRPRITAGDVSTSLSVLLAMRKVV